MHHYKLPFILKEKNCSKLLRDAESKKLEEHTNWSSSITQSALATLLRSNIVEIEQVCLGINMYIHVYACMQ